MDNYSQRGPESTAKISDHPIHPMLVPIPIACFIGALLTDIGFLATSDPFWARASGWLLGAGIIGGILAALAGGTDFFANARIRALSRAWQHGIGNALALLVAVVNFFLRRPDWTDGVLPFGIILSLVTVGILVFTGWLGGELVYRHGVAVVGRDPARPTDERMP